MKNIITKIIVFTIIASMLIAVPYPSQTKAADLVYTYWDLWYSLSSAANYSMQEKNDVFTTGDISSMKFKWESAWKGYNIWLDENYPELSSYDMELQSYLDAKADERDRARVQFQDFLFYLKDNSADLIPQAYDLINNAKTAGIEISQELWDAVTQYFSDVANDKKIESEFSQTHSFEDLVSYLKVIAPEYNLSNITADRVGLFCVDELIVVNDYSRGYLKLWSISSYNGKFEYASDGFIHPHDANDNHVRINYFCIRKDGSVLDYYYDSRSDGFLSDGSYYWRWKYPTTVKDAYSPFIDYTVTDACPQEVPEVIPWKVLPREITDEETKIKTNPPENPDDDDENKPAVIPPIHDLPNPDGTEQESETEEETEEETEKETDETNKNPKPVKPEDMNDINLLADLTEIFPFCIPFDISRALKAMKKEAGTAPKFTIPFEMSGLGIDEEIVIDFANFEPLTKVLRAGTLILYIIGLMWATSKVMKW